MKPIVVLLIIGACVYYFLTHREPAPKPAQAAPASAPAASATAAATPQAAATPSNFLKRPIDRAREVAGQESKRAGEKF